MSRTCNVLGTVIIEGAAFMGSNPHVGTYVCVTSSTVLTPLGGSLVCSGALLASSAGKFLQDPAVKAVVKEIKKHGCNLIVKIGDDVTELIVIEGKSFAADWEKKSREAKKIFRVFDRDVATRTIMRLMSNPY